MTAVGVASTCLRLAPMALAAPAAPAALATSEVSVVTADGQHLGGTVYEPRDAGGTLPGLVLIHGSGTGERRSLLPEAEAFARQGIAVLVYDKRSVGYSDAHRDYTQLAGDAIAAVDVLRQQPRVDRAHVGVWGISEGGWVAPIAAAGSTHVAFMVAASAPGLAPLRTQQWNMRNKVSRAGITGSLARTLTSRAYRLSADAGLFAEPYYDPRPTLHRITAPVLSVYGTADDQIAPAESATVFEQEVRGPLTVRFIDGAGHALRLRDADGNWTPDLVPGYADLVGTWVRSVADGDVPASFADVAPAQPIRSVALHPSAWWEGWLAQVTALVLMLAAFVSYPVIAGMRRIRRRPAPAFGAPRVLVATGLTAVLGLLGYVGYVVASTDSKGISAGPVAHGHSIIWLLLQADAITAVISGGLALRHWRAAGPERLRLGLLLVGGLVFVPWSLYWGLLLP